MRSNVACYTPDCPDAATITAIRRVEKYVRVLRYLDEAVYGEAESVGGRRIMWCLLACLYLLGVVYWIGFFDAGRVSLTAADWVWQSATLDTVRSALSSGALPWQWGIPSGALASEQARFLVSIVALTPDVALLQIVSNAVFALVHVVILYTMGFFGSVRLARRVNANLMSLAFFWILFNFSGFITAHIAIGHFEFAGYFLLPIFLDLALGVAVRSTDRTRAIDLGYALWIGLVIGALILNGSVHFAVWCCAFLVLMSLWRWRLLPTVGVATTAGVALGLGRLLPSALYVPSPGTFISGYPDLSVLLTALTTIRVPDYSYTLGGNWGALWWWEYDVYVGIAALVVLTIAVVVAFRRHRHARIAPALAAGAALFLFSLGDNYALIRRAIPVLGDTERVSTRLAVIPFLLMLVVATEGLALAFREWPRTSRVFSAVALPVIGWQLAMHAKYWTVAGVERLLSPDAAPALRIIASTDTQHTIIVFGSWMVSLIALCAVAALLWRQHRAERGGTASCETESDGTAGPARCDWLAYDAIDGTSV